MAAVVFLFAAHGKAYNFPCTFFYSSLSPSPRIANGRGEEEETYCKDPDKKIPCIILPCTILYGQSCFWKKEALHFPKKKRKRKKNHRPS